MKNIIFGKNEILYLKDKKMFEEQYSKNYIYQIRHSIRKKIYNYLNNDDIDLFLSFKIMERKNNLQRKSLINDGFVESLILKILKTYPYLIIKILRLPEIKEYLGKKYFEF